LSQTTARRSANVSATTYIRDRCSVWSSAASNELGRMPQRNLKPISRPQCRPVKLHLRHKRTQRQTDRHCRNRIRCILALSDLVAKC